MVQRHVDAYHATFTLDGPRCLIDSPEEAANDRLVRHYMPRLAATGFSIGSLDENQWMRDLCPERGAACDIEGIKIGKSMRTWTAARPSIPITIC